MQGNRTMRGAKLSDLPKATRDLLVTTLREFAVCDAFGLSDAGWNPAYETWNFCSQANYEAMRLFIQDLMASGHPVPTSAKEFMTLQAKIDQSVNPPAFQPSPQLEPEVYQAINQVELQRHIRLIKRQRRLRRVR